MIKRYRGLIKRTCIYGNMKNALRIVNEQQDIYILNRFIFPTFNRRSRELDSRPLVETGDVDCKIDHFYTTIEHYIVRI